MVLRPVGRKIGESLIGEMYEDSQGTFFIKPRNLGEVLEARVTNGRGYITKKNFLDTPYAENPYKDRIDPSVFCLKRMNKNKFPDWKRDLEEGHPAYQKIYCSLISLDKYKLKN